MRLDIAAQTDIGRRKKSNEDFYGVFRENTPGLTLFREGALLCVADGLGGHTAGDIASKLAVSVVKDALKEPPPPPGENPGEDMGPLTVVEQFITLANENIYKTNQDLIKNGRPMGTTLLAAVVTPEAVYVGNVGDSRCYHLRDGEMIAKTEDHSWVDEQVRLGMMSKAEAESDGRRNIVTRSVGTHPQVPVDKYRWHAAPGDKLLMCSDGLVNMVKDAEIRELFAQGGSAADIAHRLVERANDNGGKDNITVIVVTISPNPFRLAFMRARRFFRKSAHTLMWLFLLLVAAGAGFAAGYFVRGLIGK